MIARCKLQPTVDRQILAAYHYGRQAKNTAAYKDRKKAA
jgi:hypothetical protein